MGVEPVILAHEAPFDLGPVKVRPEVREIEFGGRAAILEPRVMQVLVALARAGGHVVSKDDLVSTCWDNRVVGDDAINRVISRLRHTAQHDAGASFKVETITKVGYRLSLASGEAIAAAPIDRRGLLRASGAVAVAGVAAFAAVRLMRGGGDEDDARLNEIRRTLLIGTPDQIDNGATQLRDFLSESPESAAAWGLYAIASAMQSSQAPQSLKPAAEARAKAAAGRALRLEPGQPEARTAMVALGPTYGHWTRQFPLLEAIRRDSPDCFSVHDVLSRLCANVGLVRLSLERANSALAIELDAPNTWMLKALALDNLERTADAQAAIEDAYRRWPKQYAVWFTRLYLLGYNGRTQDALAMTDTPGNWPVGVTSENQRMTRAQIAALGDQRQSVIDEAMAMSFEMAPKGTGFAENAMIFAGAVGRKDQFFELAERYFFDSSFIVGATRFSEEQRVYSRRLNTFFLFRRPLLGVWRDRRFDALLERIGLERFWKDTSLTPDFRSLA